MIKKIVLFVIFIVLVAGIGYFWYMGNQPKPEVVNLPGTERTVLNPRNGTYIIEGKSITLKGGYFEELAAPGSASKMVTQYFGNEVQGDFNGDGVQDAAFILTQNSGGTGTFFYVSALVSSEENFAGTNAILLGDRIAPQTTEFANGMVVVNYADRNPGEPFTTIPSVGVSRYFKVVNGQLVESTKDGREK